MITVTHLITGLGKGGAESMLFQVLKNKTNASIEYHVISMGGSHYYEKLIGELKIEMLEVPFRRKPISSIWKIVRYLRETKTNIICCWMYHANFVGYVTGRLAGVKKVIWNIRHGDLNANLNKSGTLRINKVCAILSKSKNITAIAYNGVSARKTHEDMGYFSDKGVVLENGVDIQEFRPIENARKDICQELGIDYDAKIILSAARYHPIKDIPMFIKAVARVQREFSEVVAIMCGTGIESSNHEVMQLCKEENLAVGKNIFLLGLRNDISKLMSASDLYILHSKGEAFPNTLVQAMACGCACLTTNVGDASRIINNSRRIVVPGDVDELCNKIREVLLLNSNDRICEKEENLKRASEKYNINSVVQCYERVYER